MEDTFSASENHDSDWEEVLLPVSQELQFSDGGGSSSFSCSDVIRSNYFSIETPFQNPKLATSLDFDSPKDESFPEIDATASWMDPGQFSGSRVSSSSSDSSKLSLSPRENGSGVEIGCEIESPLNSLSGVIDSQCNSDKEIEGEVENDEKYCSSESDIENGNEKRSVVWWREVLKYFVFRVSPVWSLSVAVAALMGFVLYRRRLLSKMKRKTQGIQLHVTVDDKKVSQFTSHVARLNEAFSVVKRVPIIRPSLPAPGFAQWPVVSFR